MKLSDFKFDLPDDLIAQHPLAQRSASRLLHIPSSSDTLLNDCQFNDFIDLLQPNDLVVLNNTKVIPARLFGAKATGGRVEILIERITGLHTAVAHMRSSKSPKAGAIINVDGGNQVEVTGREGALFQLHFVDAEVLAVLDGHGHMPLPPYIERADDIDDLERYQTVFAQNAGAVAAPTAGLHFDEAMLAALAAKGIATAQVTLHVGAGTFQPVRTDDLDEHIMHSEWLEVSADVCAAVAATKARGGRVVAIGTTVVRSLETAAAGGTLQPYAGETRLFIRPGYTFHVVDALFTNFHLSESTLLMLVCAFGGYPRLMAAYAHAIEQRYRFFSYGDAMFIEAPANRNSQP